MDTPLVKHIFTADPSAHAFEGKIYIYPSHDRETDIKFNDNGDQYDMADYHVLSLTTPDDLSSVTDHGVVLKLSDIPWASKQVWAPDAAFNAKTGNYHLFFPARDKEDIFRIGVATSTSGPAGPFVAEPNPIPGSYSIDPCSFVDPKDGQGYLYVGGLWGGQLQCYSSNHPADVSLFDKSKLGPQEPSGPGVQALCPRAAKLSEDMLTFSSPVQNVIILAPETGKPIEADDHARRFFEAPWVHKYNDTYYFSYSTGDTHFIVYATGDNPLGPFTYRGKLLDPVLGWTTHHSIVEFEGKWYLFYHDCELSGGVDHLRSVKMREIIHDAETGMIRLTEPQKRLNGS